jgi:hypothetical protein
MTVPRLADGRGGLHHPDRPVTGGRSAATERTMDDALQDMIDREAIRLCLARLARGEDRRDATLIQSCWWPDAHFDFGIKSGDFAAYLAWVVPGAQAVRNTQHFLGQSHFERSSDGDDNLWLVETPMLSPHRIATGADSARDICIAGRYLDRFVRRDGEWRIAERLLLYDWSQDFGAAADWSQGVMGAPFSAPHFAGSAQGDHSADFFGKSR